MERYYTARTDPEPLAHYGQGDQEHRGRGDDRAAISRRARKIAERGSGPYDR